MAGVIGRSRNSRVAKPLREPILWSKINHLEALAAHGFVVTLKNCLIVAAVRRQFPTHCRDGSPIENSFNLKCSARNWRRGFSYISRTGAVRAMAVHGAVPLIAVDLRMRPMRNQ